MTTLFISDLHLDGCRTDITQQFLDFLYGEARHSEALYILGDLCELWIGDDDDDAGKRRIVSALRSLTSSGVRCCIMRGNRDFLLGARFARETGCELLADGTVVDLYGKSVLLMHGDTLCTDDHLYQRLRRIVRNPVLQWIVLRLPLAKRHSLAGKMREGSKAHITRTASTIMDVNADAVARSFAKWGVDTLIHGHTHRPAIHRVTNGETTQTRIVLGDWYTQGSVLRFAPEGYELTVLPRG